MVISYQYVAKIFTNENEEFKSEIDFLECLSESIFFTKNHFFTNKNIFYKQLSTKSIEIYSCMYHDVILSNRYYREKLYIYILLVDNCL